MKKLKKMTFANIDKMLEANQIQALSELHSIIGGGSGTSSDPFSWNEFMEMSFAGNWAGGYVTDCGYVAQDVFSFGYQSRPGKVNQTTYTLQEYAEYFKKSGDQYLGDAIIDNAPFVGIIFGIYHSIKGYFDQQDQNMYVTFMQELLNQGYSGDQLFYMVETKINAFKKQYTAYDIYGNPLSTHTQYWGVNTK